MESVTFCGQTCHTVMQPEFTAYQNSPHSRVECVKCHIGAGASWFVKSKLSGTRQLFAVSLHTYPTPIPTPVHNLRPARETCEQCHWPQKYGEDRLRVIPKYASDETNTLTKTVLLDEDRRRQQRNRHSRDAPGPRRDHPLRPSPTKRARRFRGWSTTTTARRRYMSPSDAKPMTPADQRTMDCMDCHNRPAHSYDLPERGVDKAMNNGLISAALPFAKKKAVEILKVPYLSREEAAAEDPGGLRQVLPGELSGHLGAAPGGGHSFRKGSARGI